MNITLVEDDPLQSMPLCNWLEAEGYTCRIYNSGNEFINGFSHTPDELLILDWELPDSSGIELLSWVRQRFGSDIPVVFITQRGREEDMVRALHDGADDYLVKPARRQELLARLEAILRRRQQTNQPRQQTIGPFTVDLQGQRLIRNGAVLELTAKEFCLANYLLRNLGQLIDRKTLLEKVWGVSAEVHTRTVDTHISRLRKKLDLTPENGWHLSAVYQYGYRLDRLQPDTALATASI